MIWRPNWVGVARYACAIFSVLVLWRVLHSIHIHEIIGTFMNMQFRWFLAATLLYGALFIPAATRWHLVLKLADAVIRPTVTLRYTIIGHFFYTLLFGAIGGDSAKIVLYSRRYGISFPRLLATAPVDRFLGTTSSMLLLVLLLLTGLPHLQWRFPWRWILIAVPAALALLIVIRPKRFAFWRQFVESLKHTTKTILVRPRTVLIGVACGLCCQIALCLALAFNLLAVSPNPLPLSRMFWTFPAVVAISGMPVSVGGLGAREAGAVFLFGLYGVPPATAASAALLTFTASIIWAAVGAFLISDGSSPFANQSSKFRIEGSKFEVQGS